MSQQLINIGNTANDGTGVRLRDAFRIVNENFTEVYTSLSGNITAFNATFSGNVRLNTLGRTGGNLYYLPLADGGAGQVLATDGAGLLSWTNNGSGASPTQLTNGTSNVILALNGNLAVSVGGTSNVMVVSATSANITGTANISSNITVGNINSVSGILSVTGNANVGNLGATRGVFTNISGTIESGSASQTNITAVGTLGSLTVSGNAFLATSSGNVGIGTSSPRSILNTNVGTITAPAVTPGLMLTSVYSGVTAVNSIDWNYSGQTTSPVRLGATFNADGAGMEMAFYTSTSYTANGSERVRINKDGNVGIGNTAPAHTLSITGTLNASGNANVGNLGATASVVTRSLHTGVLAAALPAAAAANAGAIQYVTDASATTIGSVVAGGGANKVMVWSNGTNWKIFAS